MNPKVRPADLPMFQRLVGRARRLPVITMTEYQQLEDAFIAAQGKPGEPGFLWGLGHRSILRRALSAAGIRIADSGLDPHHHRPDGDPGNSGPMAG